MNNSVDLSFIQKFSYLNNNSIKQSRGRLLVGGGEDKKPVTFQIKTKPRIQQFSFQHDASPSDTPPQGTGQGTGRVHAEQGLSPTVSIDLGVRHKPYDMSLFGSLAQSDAERSGWDREFAPKKQNLFDNPAVMFRSSTPKTATSDLGVRHQPSYVSSSLFGFPAQSATKRTRLDKEDDTFDEQNVWRLTPHTPHTPHTSHTSQLLVADPSDSSAAAASFQFPLDPSSSSNCLSGQDAVCQVNPHAVSAWPSTVSSSRSPPQFTVFSHKTHEDHERIIRHLSQEEYMKGEDSKYLVETIVATHNLVNKHFSTYVDYARANYIDKVIVIDYANIAYGKRGGSVKMNKSGLLGIPNISETTCQNIEKHLLDTKINTSNSLILVICDVHDNRYTDLPILYGNIYIIEIPNYSSRSGRIIKMDDYYLLLVADLFIANEIPVVLCSNDKFIGNLDHRSLPTFEILKKVIQLTSLDIDHGKVVGKHFTHNRDTPLLDSRDTSLLDSRDTPLQNLREISLRLSEIILESRHILRYDRNNIIYIRKLLKDFEKIDRSLRQCTAPLCSETDEYSNIMAAGQQIYHALKTLAAGHWSVVEKMKRSDLAKQRKS